MLAASVWTHVLSEFSVLYVLSGGLMFCLWWSGWFHMLYGLCCIVGHMCCLRGLVVLICCLCVLVGLGCCVWGLENHIHCLCDPVDLM